jgi:anti-sigma factor RsiW
MPDHLAAEHISLDDLADFTVGELPADSAAAVQEHLTTCSSCRVEMDQLSVDLDQVSAELGALAVDPGPTAMPVTVAARLDRLLAAEADAQTGGRGNASVTPLRPSTPLKAPATATYVKQTGVVRLMLAAAVAAAVVGFGGYVVSASAGLNEPSALSPTQVHPNALASQAKTLAESRDLDPHLFSAAWRCARKVTTGRITGITPVYVDGDQNYLVYTRTNGVSYATLVSGCDDESPTAEHRVQLTE